MSAVAVFSGGLSDEHDVSLSSGKKVMSVLPEAISVVIRRDGSWHVGGVAQATAGTAIDAVKARADVAFLALHGPFGEDGTIQGFLETHGLAYTGSGVAASALAMDKPRTKMIYRQHGLPTPPFAAVDRRGWRLRRREALDAAERAVAYPCVVKPARLGSSVGISFPADRAALEAAIDALLATTEDVIVERFIQGRELTCGVLENAAEDKVFALPPTEIIPGREFTFFDYTAKYTPGATEEITPARIPPEVTAEVQRLALAAHEALGCRDFSRTDFMLTQAGELFALETNTIPGLTPTSLLPQGAAAIGVDYATLIAVAVDNARRRKRQ